jgi:hypothetical protein
MKRGLQITIAILSLVPLSIQVILEFIHLSVFLQILDATEVAALAMIA